MQRLLQKQPVISKAHPEPDVPFLKHQQYTAIIYAGALSVTVPQRPVQCHDRCNSTVDFFGAFFFVRLDVTGRVSTDLDVIHHPAQNRLTAVRDSLLQCQLHEFLCWRRHVLESLTEWSDRETHAFKVLYHLHRTPTVERDFFDSLPTMQYVLLAGNRVALSFCYVKILVCTDNKGFNIFIRCSVMTSQSGTDRH